MAVKNYEIPNREYLEFNYVGRTANGRGNNSVVTLEKINDTEFNYTTGIVGIRVGANKPRSYKKEMAEWDQNVTFLLKKGYTITKTEKLDAIEVTKQSSFDGGAYKALSSQSVKEIIERILGFANKFFQDSYTVKVEAISPEMIELGKRILEGLSLNFEKMDVKTFNGYLMKLYSAVPRRIDNLGKLLAKKPSDFRDIVAREQENFDIMLSQVSGSAKAAEADKTILEAYNLEWREVTPEEEAYLKKKLGSEGHRYKQAWRVTNTVTEERFNNFCKQYNCTKENGRVNRLFHGSRSENFWSIITNGLTINPVGVVITGKMFGNGTYFAPDACKSMGYTDRYGSRWANGGSNTGFLGLYKVATGESAAPSQAKAYTWSSLIKDGFHSVWCKRGGQIGLRMDEVVVYQDCQDTIEYLIEVGF